MGVKIQGNRLGLGINLDSDTPTLIEKYGLDKVNTELSKNSNYYNSCLSMKIMQNKYKNALMEFQRVFYIESYSAFIKMEIGRHEHNW